MSLPNCLLLVSECIWVSAAPLRLFSASLSLAFSFGVGEGAETSFTSRAPPPLTILLSDECRLAGALQVQLVFDLLVTGESGISCASGWGLKFVMASITSTRGAMSVLDDGKMLGAVLEAESVRSCSRVQVDLFRSSDRWIDVYL
jgi:hypothetical protein